MKYPYNTIEEALEDLKAGKIILVTDDPERENEGEHDLCRRICHAGKYQFYGKPCKGADLYSDVEGTGK